MKLRFYKLVAFPKRPKPSDEGLKLEILLPATNGKQAAERFERYAPGLAVLSVTNDMLKFEERVEDREDLPISLFGTWR